MMVAPALDYNPRRIKHFINVFRLEVYIASETGLFFQERDEDDNLLYPSLTLEQLGKFNAISLKLTLLLSDLENDQQILAKLEKFARRESMQSNKEKTKNMKSRCIITAIETINKDREIDFIQVIEHTDGLGIQKTSNLDKNIESVASRKQSVK